MYLYTLVSGLLGFAHSLPQFGVLAPVSFSTAIYLSAAKPFAALDTRTPTPTHTHRKRLKLPDTRPLLALVCRPLEHSSTDGRTDEPHISSRSISFILIHFGTFLGQLITFHRNQTSSDHRRFSGLTSRQLDFLTLSLYLSQHSLSTSLLYQHPNYHLLLYSQLSLYLVLYHLYISCWCRALWLDMQILVLFPPDHLGLSSLSLSLSLKSGVLCPPAFNSFSLSNCYLRPCTVLFHFDK
jgi:hypothetical protein